MNTLARQIKEWRESKGFVTPRWGIDADLMLGKLMLVVSEVSEAAEAVRSQDKENFAEELADIVIRVLDIAATCEIDIEQAIVEKMAINVGRPFRHGRKTTL